jgi:hypothetical protein
MALPWALGKFRRTEETAFFYDIPSGLGNHTFPFGLSGGDHFQNFG